MVMRATSHDALSMRDREILWEVYAAAVRVEASLPDDHSACIAARKIIASFHGELDTAQIASFATH